MMFSVYKIMKNHFGNFKGPKMSIIKKKMHNYLFTYHSSPFLEDGCKILLRVVNTALAIATQAYLVYLAFLANLAN